MRIIAVPYLSVVVKVQTHGEPLVVVPTGPPEQVLRLAQAVLNAEEFEVLRTDLGAAPPRVHRQRQYQSPVLPS